MDESESTASSSVSRTPASQRRRVGVKKPLPLPERNVSGIKEHGRIGGRVGYRFNFDFESESESEQDNFESEQDKFQSEQDISESEGDQPVSPSVVATVTAGGVPIAIVTTMASRVS